MTEEEGDYCLSCNTREGFDYKTRIVDLYGWRGLRVHIVICHNCGYIHMYKTTKRKSKPHFSE